MNTLGLNEIREKYLQFFEEKEHLRLPSFSLVPKNDPSILLINAGMTPMKAYFTGKEVPPSKRITTCQKCIRTGDIENVGITDRHVTYFEMLGNFSFGDYFKAEMIPWIWEFCTQVLGMDPDRLYPSVFEEDDEAYEIWRDVVGLEESRISRLGKEHNFWEHGVGPSGPCTEVYYDRGEEIGCGSEDCRPGCECDRFMEFWNSVFTQFDRQEDGTYLPLEQKNIDTGVGLERLATLIQGVDSVFEIDTMRAILNKVCALASKTYNADKKTDIAIRIITDHSRSAVMMIADGITPSNGGRGYVLRRLMRRAIRNARQIGIEGPFLEALAEVIIDINKGYYPELEEHKVFIMQTIKNEEKSFDKTLQQGNQFLSDYIAEAKTAGQNSLQADDVFRLHDTYGFPLDLTKEIAAEEGLEVDEDGFYQLMEEQRRRAQENTKSNVKTAWGGISFPEAVTNAEASVFTGYERLEDEANLLFILQISENEENLEEKEHVGEGESFIFITDKTPFYAQGGGQAGDIGIASQGTSQIKVLDTTKTAAGIYLHHAEVEQGILQRGVPITLEVDKKNRMATMRNHTATHLLHKALREVLGAHVTQAGSEVNASHLRFDFSHFQQVSSEEIEKINRLVNIAILEAYPVSTEVMSIQEAKDKGAMALFDEKYGDAVRVVSVGDFSMELCGGTHLSNSAEIASFRITSESSIAAGVRRIEAVTGEVAFELSLEENKQLQNLASMLRTNVSDLDKRLEQVLQENRTLARNLESLQAKETQAANKAVEEKVRTIGDISVIVSEVLTQDQNAMRELGDRLKEKFSPSVIFLARQGENNLQFLAMASDEAVAKGIHCGNLIKETAKLAGGGGGGRPNMAQAGGKDTSQLEAVLNRANELIDESLN